MLALFLLHLESMLHTFFSSSSCFSTGKIPKCTIWCNLFFSPPPSRKKNYFKMHRTLPWKEWSPLKNFSTRCTSCEGGKKIFCVKKNLKFFSLFIAIAHFEVELWEILFGHIFSSVLCEFTAKFNQQVFFLACSREYFLHFWFLF